MGSTTKKTNTPLNIATITKRQRDSYLRQAEANRVDNIIDLPHSKSVEIIKWVASRYKNAERSPFLLTYGQSLVFYAIAFRAFPYAQFLTSTQYGKSDTVSIAVLERVTNFPEEWIITAPSEAKGAIIMRKIISHIFDNEKTLMQFDEDVKDEKILHSKSKDRVTFSMLGTGGVGQCRVVTAGASNKKQGIEAVMGEGASSVICDESALLTDAQEAGIARMLGGHDNSCYIKIGNPFYRNHFYKSWHDNDYKKVFIDYRQAIVEKRITQEKIDKAKEKPFFGVLYNCQFPDEEKQDSKGFMQLLTNQEIEKASAPDLPKTNNGAVYGVDVAGGGSNFSVIVKRTDYGLEKVYKKNQPSVIDFALDIIQQVKADGHKDYKVVVDGVGVGRGVYDYLKRSEIQTKVILFEGGASPKLEQEKGRFSNIRALCYWRLREALLTTTKLLADDDWQEIALNRYNVNDAKKIKMMSKIDMASFGIESPDVADSASMCFFVDVPTPSERRIDYNPIVSIQDNIKQDAVYY